MKKSELVSSLLKNSGEFNIGGGVSG